jgi:tellurium resistance protein TerZ
MSVNLSKGQTVSLTKHEGGTLSRVKMGLGWEPAKKKGLFGRFRTREIDLDASCLLFDGSGNLVDQVWFQQLQSKDGALLHTGDNLTGAGEGDDESIIVYLTALPAQVSTLVFTVSSFSGQDFTQIENAFCRLVDEATGAELARYDLSESGKHTSQIMAKVGRDGAGWSMTAIGAAASGRTIQDLVPAATAQL